MLSEGASTFSLLPADPVLRFALYSSIALIATTLLVMLQVLVLSERAIARARRRTAFNQLWRTHFAACSLGIDEDQRPEPPPPGQRLWFLLQWSQFQQHLRGPARERMNALLISLGMERHALQLLASDGTRRQLVALMALRHLADPAHQDEVERHLHSDNHAIALAAAQAMVAMSPRRAIGQLLADAMAGGRWTVAQLASLCRQAGSAAVTIPLLEALERADTRSRRRLSSLIAYADAQAAAPWARRIVAEHNHSAEETRAALRCLQEAADPRDRAGIVDALAHEDPDVRISALGAFRRIATLDDAPRLLELTADRSWWVRQAAADALVALPGVDPQRLTQWLDTMADAYGRDALTRAMAEAR